jgi:hypothetical protein
MISSNRNTINKNQTNSRKDINRLGGATITDFYYKNPFFYNEENLNLQLKVLKELKNIKLKGNLTPVKKIQKYISICLSTQKQIWMLMKMQTPIKILFIVMKIKSKLVKICFL